MGRGRGSGRGSGNDIVRRSSGGVLGVGGCGRVGI